MGMGKGTGVLWELFEWIMDCGEGFWIEKGRVGW